MMNAIEKGMSSRLGPLADEFIKLYESPDPENIYTYSPGLCRTRNGRLIATMDVGGPGVENIPGAKCKRDKSSRDFQGKVFTSDDRGKTWIHRVDFPFMHARPFEAGRSIYILGHCGDLAIIRSDDRGITWSESSLLTDNARWL